jgi:tyrosine-protein phosphatase SIW14
MRRTLLLLPFLSFLLVGTDAALAQSSPGASSPVLRASFGEKLQLPGLPNAGKISDALYRGAQPRANGFAQLKKLGVTTIVDLRSEDPGKREWERKHAEALGIRFLNIPVGGWSPPTDEQAAQFLALFRDGTHQKIFVHCHYGDDRTGVFVATYRMAYDRWPADTAIREMYFFGFHRFWHPSMESFVHDFPAHLTTAPALRPFRATAPPEAATKP